MAAKPNSTVQDLRREILAWVRETEALLTTCQVLVEYFGTDEEIQSFVEASQGARRMLKGMAVLVRSRFERRVKAEARSMKFACSVELAVILSPILQVLATPVPDFVAKARRDLSAAHASNVVNTLGLFMGIMAENIYTPVWAIHRHLAPDGYPL